MASISDKWIDDVLVAAKENAADLQPWQNYYESKARELKTIMRFSGPSCLDSVLEIGCGNGFTALLLSERARRVEALDLPLKNQASHTPGINTAGELVKRLAVKNVHIVGGTAETLPFDDCVFSAIFSEYALQYVRNKDKALAEMRRVVTPDGRAVIVVPNFTERILNPVMKYKYVIQRCIERLLRPGSSKSPGGAREVSAWRKEETAGLFAPLGQLLLRPDGAYRSFLEEMRSHTSLSWRRLFEKNGFKVVRVFTTQIMPLGIFDIMGPTAMRLLSSASHQLDMKFGNLPGIKNIGYSLGFTIMKD